MAELIEVEGNPFKKQAQSMPQPKLVPVDGDPFASPPRQAITTKPEENDGWLDSLGRGIRKVGPSWLSSAATFAEAGLRSLGSSAPQGSIEDEVAVMDKLRPGYSQTPQGARHIATLKQAQASAKPTIAQKTFDALADEAGDFAEHQDYIRRTIDQEKPDDLQRPLWGNPDLLTDLRWWTENGVDTAASMVPTIVSYYIGGPTLAGASGGGMEGGSLYRELIDENIPEERARRAATAYGVVSGVLNSFGAEAMLGEKGLQTLAGKGLFKRLARRGVSGLSEGTTEYLEEPASAAYKALAEGKSGKQTIDAVLKSFANVESLVLGTAMGGVTNSIASHVNEAARKPSSAIPVDSEASAQAAPVPTPEPIAASATDVDIFTYLDPEETHDVPNLSEPGMQAEPQMQEMREQSPEVIPSEVPLQEGAQASALDAQDTIPMPDDVMPAQEEDPFQIPLPEEEPLPPSLDEAAHEAATSPYNDHPEPTVAQQEAGNYKKGKLRILGLDISIENPADSQRKGIDPDGQEWSQDMANHYGYIRGTEGKDKDHLDVFLGPNMEALEQKDHPQGQIAIVDQIDPKTGKFDEHKIVLGVQDLAQAEQTYLANYDVSGPQRIGDITMMTPAAFKNWLKHGNTKRAVAYRPAKQGATDALSTLSGTGQEGQSVSPMRQDAGASPAEVTNAANLYSGIPLPELKKLGGNIKKAMPILKEAGMRAYEAGHQTLDAFKREMKRVLGTQYKAFKSAMIKLFQEVKAKYKASPLSDQRGSFSLEPATPSADQRLIEMNRTLNPPDGHKSAYLDLKMDIREELEDTGRKWKDLSEPERHAVLDKIETFYPELQQTKGQDAQRKQWEIEDLLDSAEMERDAGATTHERLEQLRQAYRALPEGELKQEVLETGKQYAQALSSSTEQTLQEKITEEMPNTIKESAKKHLPKELVKTKQATQFIGEGAKGSSTDRYRSLYKKHGVANTGTYSDNDVIYVSSNGKRLGRVEPVKNGKLQGVYQNIDKAIAVGAKVIMDTPAHLQKTANYNLGELALAEYMATHGYEREGDTGVWAPKTEVSPKTEAVPKTDRPMTKKEQAVKNWRDLEAVAPQDMDDAELKALRAKRYQDIQNEGRHGKADTTGQDGFDFSLDMEQDDQDIYEPTNWGRSQNAASLDETKGFSQDTSFQHRVDQSRNEAAFKRIRRKGDLSKDLHDKTPSAEELKRIDTEAEQENAKVLQQAYNQMGNNPKLAKGSPSMRDVIANELKMLGETYLLRDVIDFIKKREGIQSFSKLNGYPDSLFEFISYHESLSSPEVVESQPELAETPSLRFVQRVIHALHPAVLTKVKGLLTAKSLEAQLSLTDIKSGKNGVLSAKQASQNKEVINLLFRKPQKLIAFALEHGANIEKFRTEFGKVVDNHFKEAFITQDLLDAIVKAARAEDYEFASTEPHYDQLVEASQREKLAQDKTAIPKGIIKKDPTVHPPRNVMRQNRLKQQYRLFKERFAKENTHDAVIADNWLSFFQAVQTLATTGPATQKNAYDPLKIARSMHHAKGQHNMASDAFRALDEQQQVQVVERMLEHSAIKRPWAKRKNTDEYLGENQQETEYVTSEVAEQTREVTQLGEPVIEMLEPVDSVWTDPITGNERTDGQLDTVKLDSDGNLLRFEQANDLVWLIQDLFASDLGEAIAKQRGHASLEEYRLALGRWFKQGWPTVKPTDKPGYARRDAGQKALYKELPFLRAARLTRQFQTDLIPTVDYFDQLSKQYPQLTAEEMYDVFAQTGSLSSLTNEINRRGREQRQLQADANHAELMQEKKKQAAAKKIAKSFLNPRQQDLFDGIAAGKKSFRKDALLAGDKEAVAAAFRIEQDLLAGNMDVADIKQDHGLPVFPEDFFQKQLDATFEATASLAGVQTGKLRNPIAQKFYNVVAKAFGAQLIIVSDPNYRSRYDGKTQQIIINVQEKAPLHRVFAHELFHHVVNKADPAAYREFVRAVKAMVGPERWDAAQGKYGGPVTNMEEALNSFLLDDEEMLADLFSEVFTHRDFYAELSKNVPGRTLAQKLIGRLLSVVEQVMGVLDGKSRWGYEENLLLGPGSMSQVHALLGELIGTMGTATHSDVRYFTPFGQQPSNIKLDLSKTMSRIFPRGSKAYSTLADAVEHIVERSMKTVDEVSRFFMADRGAIKPAIRLASLMAHTAEQQVQKFEARIGSKYGSVFQDFIKSKIEPARKKIQADLKSGKLTAEQAQQLVTKFSANHLREVMHDDFVRRPLSAEQLQAKYPPVIHEAFAAMKTMADEIALELKKIDPEFNARQNHYMQSIKWRKTDGVPFDDSFAALLDRSRLEGDKSFLKTKDTERTTAEIREAGFEYRTLDPIEVARQYVRDSYQLLAYRQMIEEGMQTNDNKGQKMIRLFATPQQAAAAGYLPVNDHATALTMRLNLEQGFRVKLEKGYLQEGGSELVFGTEEEAQRKADEYQKAFGETATVTAVKGQQRVTEGPQWLIAAIDPENTRTEFSKRFETQEEAQAYADARLKFDAEGNYQADGGGTHTKDGRRFLVEKERIAPETAVTARHYFHPHLARMISRTIAPNPLLTGNVGKVGKKIMAVKNEMTMWEFSWSLFHAIFQAQELVNDRSTRHMVKGNRNIKEWAKSFNPIYSFRETQKVASLLEAVAKDPNLVDTPAIQAEAQKLFGMDDVDMLEILRLYPLAGGLMEMDGSTQATTHGMGTMKYRSAPHHLVVKDGKVVYEAGEFGLLKGLPYVRGAVSKVCSDLLLEEPDAKVKALFNAGRFALSEGTGAWLMQYTIPRIKMTAWAHAYLQSVKKNQAQLDAGLTTKENLGYEAMMFIEDKFGEYNWQNMWLDPSMKTSLQLLFRSFTWLAGNVSAQGKAGIDFAKWGWINVARGKLGSENHYHLTEKGWWAINATISHMLTAGAMTLIYKLVMAGSDDKEAPDEEGVPLLTQYLFPRMDPKDPSYRIQIPSPVTEFWKEASHLGAFGNDVEPAKLFTGRFSSFIGQGVEAFYHGTDWRGTQIANADDSVPLSLTKKLWHTFAVTPISLSSIASQAQRKGFEADKALTSIMGFTTAPAAAMRSNATNKAFAVRRKENPGKPIEEDKANLRDKVSRAAYAYAKGDKKPLQELVKAGDISAAQAQNAIKKLPLINGRPNEAYVNPLEHALKGLTLDGAMDAWEAMTAEEKKQHRPLLVQKYRNAMSSRSKAPNDKKRFRDRMLKLQIL